MGNGDDMIRYFVDLIRSMTLSRSRVSFELYTYVQVSDDLNTAVVVLYSVRCSIYSMYEGWGVASVWPGMCALRNRCAWTSEKELVVTCAENYSH